MHKLESPHILKFHDWYETRSGLWLILEYCTGGDLETLLKQDNHLPETSIQIFGLDILAGLKVFIITLFLISPPPPPLILTSVSSFGIPKIYFSIYILSELFYVTFNLKIF